MSNLLMLRFMRLQDCRSSFLSKIFCGPGILQSSHPGLSKKDFICTLLNHHLGFFS